MNQLNRCRCPHCGFSLTSLGNQDLLQQFTIGELALLSCVAVLMEMNRAEPEAIRGVVNEAFSGDSTHLLETCRRWWEVR